VGLINGTGACFNTLAEAPTACIHPDGHFSWDVETPTAASNRQLGQMVLEAIGKQGRTRQVGAAPVGGVFACG
jgi:hypothetical protein